MYRRLFYIVSCKSLSCTLFRLVSANSLEKSTWFSLQCQASLYWTKWALAFVCLVSLFFIFFWLLVLDKADHTPLFSQRQTLLSYRIADLWTNRMVVYEFLLVINMVIVSCSFWNMSYRQNDVGFAYTSLLRPQIWLFYSLNLSLDPIPKQGKN